MPGHLNKKKKTLENRMYLFLGIYNFDLRITKCYNNNNNRTSNKKKKIECINRTKIA